MQTSSIKSARCQTSQSLSCHSLRCRNDRTKLEEKINELQLRLDREVLSRKKAEKGIVELQRVLKETRVNLQIQLERNVSAVAAQAARGQLIQAPKSPAPFKGSHSPSSSLRRTPILLTTHKDYQPRFGTSPQPTDPSISAVNRTLWGIRK